MRKRGQKFWEWADPDLHVRNHDEHYAGECFINIQARTSRERQTQIFLGIYGSKGTILLEESYWDCKGQSMSAAITWARQRAYAFLQASQR
jgi:hypothetical protein